MRRQSFYKGSLLAMLMALLVLLGGCGQQPQPAQPDMAEAEAEEESQVVDITLTPAIAPNADPSVVEQRAVTLYFRINGENLLAAETRTVFLPKDKQVEYVLVETLLGGPNPGLLELTGLFNTDAKVLKTSGSGNTLTVMLNQEFLAPPPNAPAMWEREAEWRDEVYARRQLGLASIVNTITEATDYTAVQFVVQTDGGSETGRRLLRSEIYPDAAGDALLEPIMRTEQYLMTHYNTANLILYSWREQTFDRMYRFVAEDGGRPTDAAFEREMVYADRPLIRYAVSAGTVSEDGKHAVLEVTYLYMLGGEEVLVQNFPLKLVRENGIWKITYAELQRMMEAT